jgi:putative flippase GtrA
MYKNIKKIYIEYKEIIDYLIVGVLTTIVSLTTYYGLVFTVLNPNDGIQLQIANISSWILAVTFAYFANRIFVFKSKNNNILKEASQFYASRVTTLLMDMFIMFLFVTVLHGNDKIAKIIVQVIVTICNYIFSKLFVFKQNIL